MFQDPSRVLRGVTSYRVSSWDRSGRNIDFLQLQPGQTVTLLQAEGPGKVAHFYWTTINASRFHFRQLVLRAWWDCEATPSIEAPLGDLFGVPHSTPVVFQSLGAVVNPGAAGVMTWGLNLYLPMPFAASARMELTYEPIPGIPADVMAFWYHIELEHYPQPLPGDVGRLHAQWRRENPTTSKAGTDANSPGWNGSNLGGAENYVALQAEGCGQMVGLHLQVDNLGGGWYGEGDDMVFIDGQRGEQWPPAYHGTGTEEIFGGGASPTHPYAGPYTGFHRVENPSYAGKNAMYRWYLADPIRFQRSLTWTIEHGHDNNYANDYTSLATWYQVEPHAPFTALPDVVGRLPRYPDIVLRAEAARAGARLALDRLQSQEATREVARPLWGRFHAGCKAMLEGRDEDALAEFEGIVAVG
jgi:hypothetical protein